MHPGGGGVQNRGPGTKTGDTRWPPVGSGRGKRARRGALGDRSGRDIGAGAVLLLQTPLGGGGVVTHLLVGHTHGDTGDVPHTHTTPSHMTCRAEQSSGTIGAHCSPTSGSGSALKPNWCGFTQPQPSPEQQPAALSRGGGVDASPCMIWI